MKKRLATKRISALTLATIMATSSVSAFAGTGSVEKFKFTGSKLGINSTIKEALANISQVSVGTDAVITTLDLRGSDFTNNAIQILDDSGSASIGALSTILTDKSITVEVDTTEISIEAGSDDIVVTLDTAVTVDAILTSTDIEIDGEGALTSLEIDATDADSNTPIKVTLSDDFLTSITDAVTGKVTIDFEISISGSTNVEILDTEGVEVEAEISYQFSQATPVITNANDDNEIIYGETATLDFTGIQDGGTLYYSLTSANLIAESDNEGTAELALTADALVYEAGTTEIEIKADTTVYYVVAQSGLYTTAVEKSNFAPSKAGKLAFTIISADKTALETAIATAGDLLADTDISAAGTDIAVGEYWVTQAIYDAYDTAIETATTEFAKELLNATEVSDAVSALSAATTTFTEARAEGTFVDKAALETAITTAEADLSASPEVSEDGSDIFTTDKWVTQADYDALETAIDTAQAVYDETNATVAEVADAVTALETATTAFEDAQQDGLLDVSVLTDAIAAAQALLDDTMVSVNGSDVPKNKYWVTSDVATAYSGAIETAEDVDTTVGTAVADDVVAGITALATATETFTDANTRKLGLGTDTSELVTVIEEAQALLEETAVSTDAELVLTGTFWVLVADHDTFKTAIAAATTSSEDATITAGDLATAITTLNTAIDTFGTAKKAGTYTASELEADITAAKTLLAEPTISVDGAGVSSDDKWVTQAVYDAFEDAITAAEAVVKAPVDYNTVVAAIDALNDALDTFKAAMQAGNVVDKTSLNIAISIAQDTHDIAPISVAGDGSDVFTTDEWVSTADKATFKEAIDDATDVYNNAGATVTDVDQAKTDLATATTAFENAHKDGTLDIATLTDAIADAKELLADTMVSSTEGADVPKNKYWVTQAVYEAFNNVITAAELIEETPTSTAVAVAGAINDLESATSTFTDAMEDGSGTDTSELVTVIEEAQALLDETVVSTNGEDVVETQKWVTQAVATDFETAIATATTASKNASITPGELTAAGTALTTAQTTFTEAQADGKQVDTSVLEEAIAAAQADLDATVTSVDGTDVEVGTNWATEKDKTDYQTGIDAAKNVLNDTPTAAEVATAVSTLAGATTAFETAQDDGKMTVDTLKAELATAITAAQTAHDEVKTSANGEDVFTTDEWVEESVKTAYKTAITTATTAKNAGDATIESLQTAIGALATATGTFETATTVGLVDLSDLTDAVTTAKALITNTVTSADGSGISTGTFWATEENKNTYQAAVTKADGIAKDSESTASVVATATPILTTATGTFEGQRTQVLLLLVNNL